MGLDALFRLAFATAPPPKGLSLATSNNSPDHYAKGTQSGIHESCDSRIALPPPVSRLVSGSISLPYQGFFSIFPHGTCSLSVAYEYLALEDGSPRFSRGSTYRVILGVLKGEVLDSLTYGTITLLDRSFQTVPLKLNRISSRRGFRSPTIEPHDTLWTTP